MDNKRQSFFTITFFNQMVLAAVVALPSSSLEVPNDVTAINARSLVNPADQRPTAHSQSRFLSANSRAKTSFGLNKKTCKIYNADLKDSATVICDVLVHT